MATTNAQKNTAPKKTAQPKAARKQKTPVSLEAQVYSQAGKAGSMITLPKKVFGQPWNADLVHEVVVSMMANARAGTAHSKDRSEVRGGGKKPWKQKGTGRARHGSSRSPIWVGGGTTHGPRNEKDYSKKINKKTRVKALYTVLSRKLSMGNILFVDSLSLAAIKTKDASSILSNWAAIPNFTKLGNKKKTQAVMVLPEGNVILEKSFANLSGVTVMTASALNPLIAMKYQNMVIVNPESAIAALEAKSALKGKSTE